jgi:D-threo-aldose 1-dehydrogenase
VNPLKRQELGKTGLDVTQLGFGGAPLGGFRGRIEEPEAIATVQAAVEAGLNHFDTAPFYGYGRSELRIGQVLRDVPRDRFVLSTKVGRWMEPLNSAAPVDLRPGGLPFQPRFDYSAGGAERSLEQSMMRLGIAQIDIAYIHDVDVFTHRTQEEADRRYGETLKGCLPFLERLRSSGVIKAIGAGLNETAMSLRFARDTDIDCILLAGRYTLLDQGALAELLPICVQKGISVVLGGPFNSGVLASGLGTQARFDYGAVPKAIGERVKQLAAVCARHSVDLAAAALQFPLAHAAVKSVIPGAMSSAEVHANVAFMAQRIPADFWAELRHEGLVSREAPVPGAPP